MPTRVIDVGTNTTKNIRLYETMGEKGEWIALTHLWGRSEPYFSTTRQNLYDRMAGIAWEKLPATFQDAVTVTRALGHRYLWIDSLCIIQGRDGDFNEEAKRMEEVYSGAYCVIAASCATGHQSGFLSKRVKRDAVALRGLDNNPFLDPQEQGTIYICQIIDDFKAHVLDGNLNKRAWVMQEHALARRTIFFTGHQTYWECGQGVRCETMTNMSKQVIPMFLDSYVSRTSIYEANTIYSTLAASLGDPNFPHILIKASKAERIVRYQRLFQDYSRLGLTMAYDRPVAIDGLQRRLLRVLGARGNFGVFDDYSSRGLLCRSLLWYRGEDTDRLEKIKFPADRSISDVPSWSWMAYTGGINYFKPEYDRYEWKDIDPPWSQNTHCERGVALVAEAQEYEHNVRDLFKENCKLVFDCLEEPTTKPELCVVLGVEKVNIEKGLKRHYVMLVKKTGESDRFPVCHRIGAGFLLGKFIRSTTSRISIH